jgi:hypothetical protein
MNGYSVGLLMMWIITLGGLMLSVDNITGYHWSPNLWNHLLHDTLRAGLGDRMASHDEGKADIKSYIEMTTFRLNMHDKIIEEQARAIKELAEATQKFLGAVQNIEKDRSADQKESITFKWIIEKFGMPIAIAAIGFMLFQIMPLIFVLVYYLPKLINHTP